MNTKRDLSSSVEALLKAMESIHFDDGKHTADSLHLEREYLTRSVGWLFDYLKTEPDDLAAVNFGVFFLVSVAENAVMNMELRPDN